MRLFGVDGCKSGWMVAWEDGGGAVRVECLPNITAICALKPDFLVIDIPVGLADRGAREADLQARALLGTRGCCVFPAPLRGTLACNTHQEACALGQRISGRGISIQTWGILPKIREVDAHLTPADQSRIREGHPEVSFALMNGGNPLTERKSTRAGREARLCLLEPHFPGIRDEVEKHRPFRTDVIDAFAMLWTASTPTGEKRASWGPRRPPPPRWSRSRPGPPHPGWSRPLGLRPGCRSEWL
jgi:predicted RNase H-like nuclease